MKPYFIFLAIAISAVACKNEKVIQVNNEVTENAIVVDTVVKQPVLENQNNIVSPQTAVTENEVVEEFVKTKPTVKVVSVDDQSALAKESNKSEVRPDKKPKANPVRSAPSKYLPKIKFDNTSFDFGEITEGDIVEHKFSFTNTGDNKLSIKKATASCGCTKPSFPFIDIAPGETGFIGVTYNSVNKKGVQKPEIIVHSNASQSEITLYLTGTVKSKDENGN